MVRADWIKAVAGSEFTRVEAVRSKSGYVQFVVGYFTKGWRMSDASAEDLVDVQVVLKVLRLYRSFGCLYRRRKRIEVGLATGFSSVVGKSRDGKPLFGQVSLSGRRGGDEEAGAVVSVLQEAQVVGLKMICPKCDGKLVWEESVGGPPDRSELVSSPISVQDWWYA